MKLSVQDIRTGAIYRFGAKHRLDREAIERLLVERTRFKLGEAKCIVSHWIKTEPYRS